MVATVPPPAPPGASDTGERELSDEEIAAVVARRGRLERLSKEVRQNRSLLVGLSLLGLFGAVAAFVGAAVGLGTGLFPGETLTQLASRLSWANAIYPPGPSWQHPFGVMRGLGVDLFPAVLIGTPWDLAILGGVLGPAVLLGALLGTSTGYLGGPVDAIVSMACDILLSIPPFFFVFVLWIGVAPFVPVGAQLWIFLLLLVVVLWPYYARPVRARAERVSREPYVESARASGASPAHILLRHVLPNSLFPVFAQVPVDVYNIYFVFTVFPFIACKTSGGGSFTYVSPFPSIYFPEWGNLLALGACYGWSFLPTANFWWMYAFPAVMILALGTGVMLICDGLERLLHGRA